AAHRPGAIARGGHRGPGRRTRPVRSLRQPGRSTDRRGPAHLRPRPPGTVVMNEMGSDARRRAMLATAMGPGIAAALGDPRVLEIMVNPDGALRLDLLGEGRVDTEIRLAPDEIERIIRLVASHARTEAHGA